MKTPNSLYSRLALITSVTLVVGYFVVYAAWTSISDVTGWQTLTASLINNIFGNLTDLNGRTTTLEWSIAGASVWSKIGSDINYTAGKVGIGTTTPDDKLDIENGNFRLTGTTGGWVQAVGQNLILNASSTNDIQFAQNGSIMAGIYDGNVGIGTTNPTAKLDIRSIGTNGGGITTGLVIAHIGSMGADGAGIEFTYANAGIGGNGNIARIIPYVQGGGGGDILFQTAPSNVGAYATKMIIQRGGNVGIGTTAPAVKFQVGESADGTFARANSWTTFSDERLKKDFSPIVSPLEKIKFIGGYYYSWKEGLNTKRQIGVKAQEVEKVFPEIVSTGEDGYKSVDYGKLGAILIEAVKELKSQKDTENQELKNQILELKNEIQELKINRN